METISLAARLAAKAEHLCGTCFRLLLEAGDHPPRLEQAPDVFKGWLTSPRAFGHAPNPRGGTPPALSDPLRVDLEARIWTKGSDCRAGDGASAAGADLSR